MPSRSTQPTDSPTSAQEAYAAKMATLCELSAGEEDFALVPVGKYKGKFNSGSADLELREDQRFFMRVQDFHGSESQWQGVYRWKKLKMGSELNLCQIKSLGTDHLRTKSIVESMAVMAVDKEFHRFTIRPGTLDEIRFEPTKKL